MRNQSLERRKANQALSLLVEAVREIELGSGFNVKGLRNQVLSILVIAIFTLSIIKKSLGEYIVSTSLIVD